MPTHYLPAAILQTTTEEVFDAVVTEANDADLRGKNPRNKWNFSWKTAAETATVYKIHTRHNPKVVLGLIALEDKGDSFYIALLENSPLNVGSGKIYDGVAGGLLAFACKLALDAGYDGAVWLVSKTELVEHYRSTYRFEVIASGVLALNTANANWLVHTYYTRRRWVI